MQLCTNCGHSQQQGKFCAKCGTPIAIAQQTEQVHTQPQVAPQQNAQPNVKIEQLKQVSNGYIGQFINLLKNPTKSLQESNSMINSLISSILFTLITSFTIYTMINNVFEQTVGSISSIFGEESSGLSLGIVLVIFIIIAVFIIVADIAVLALAKIFVGHASFKQLFAQITNFYPAIIALMVIAFILQLIGVTGFAILAIVLALSIAILFIPLYVIVNVLQSNKIRIDIFYVYLLMATIIFFLLYLVTNSAISSILEEIQDSFFDFY